MGMLFSFQISSLLSLRRNNYITSSSNVTQSKVPGVTQSMEKSAFSYYVP